MFSPPRGGSSYGRATNDRGERLYWPGTADGYPFKGRPPSLLKREEYEQLPLNHDVRVETLVLPTQSARYEQIMHGIANGLCQFRFEERHFNQAERTWDVLLSWVEVCGIAPEPQGGDLFPMD